ncbi:MAG: SIS domain-containing protein [Synergistaceae bacterium]|jgi:KpsF/GutQ family protein|nr:SIS domain-containing protein [Synergistaceae bacterium]
MTDEDILSEIKRVLDIEAQSVEKLKEDIDPKTVLKTVMAIADCKGKIILSACGTSAMAAQKIAHSLNCIERPALFLRPSDAVHGGLGVLQKEDLFILISKGGNTAELLSLIPACKTKDARLIIVSENADSRLAKAADIFLKIKVEREPCRFNMLATASTMAVIAMFDAICIALMQITEYTREQFAVIHPGGAVGAQLLGLGKENP